MSTCVPGWLGWLSIQLFISASGHALQVVRLSPALGSTLGMDPARIPLSLCLSPPQNTYIKVTPTVSST